LGNEQKVKTTVCLWTPEKKPGLQYILKKPKEFRLFSKKKGTERKEGRKGPLLSHLTLTIPKEPDEPG